MNRFNSNDDDIFDDSSYLTSNDEDIIESSENNNPNNIFDELFGNATKTKSKIKIDSDKLVPSLVLVFYKSVTAWIESDYDEFFHKAVFTFNDHLLNGKAKPFAFYEKYYANQNYLAKRRVVSMFLQEVIDDPKDFVDSAQNVKFPITEQVITTYFNSFYNINQFCILEEFSQYKALSQYLELPFSDVILRDAPEHGSVYGPEPYSNFVQTAFGLSVTEDYKQILQKCLKESIDEFVKIKKEED